MDFSSYKYTCMSVKKAWSLSLLSMPLSLSELGKPLTLFLWAFVCQTGGLWVIVAADTRETFLRANTGAWSDTEGKGSRQFIIFSPSCFTTPSLYLLFDIANCSTKDLMKQQRGILPLLKKKESRKFESSYLDCNYPLLYTLVYTFLHLCTTSLLSLCFQHVINTIMFCLWLSCWQWLSHC